MQVSVELLPAILHIISKSEDELKALVGIPIKLRMQLASQVVNESYVQLLVCEAFGVTWPQVIGASKKTIFKNARFAYCHFALTWLGKSTVEVGKEINRDHSTVIHARDKVKELMEANDQAITQKIAFIETKLRAA